MTISIHLTDAPQNPWRWQLHGSQDELLASGYEPTEAVALSSAAAMLSAIAEGDA